MKKNVQQMSWRRAQVSTDTKEKWLEKNYPIKKNTSKVINTKILSTPWRFNFDLYNLIVRNRKEKRS